MALPVHLQPEADVDYVEAANFYGDQSAELGVAFVDEVEAALATIAEMPLAAPVWEGRLDVRRRVLARFPYSIVYVIDADAILVIAIVHARRQPGAWLRRL